MDPFDIEIGAGDFDIDDAREKCGGIEVFAGSVARIGKGGAVAFPLDRNNRGACPAVVFCPGFLFAFPSPCFVAVASSRWARCGASFRRIIEVRHLLVRFLLGLLLMWRRCKV